MVTKEHKEFRDKIKTIHDSFVITRQPGKVSFIRKSDLDTSRYAYKGTNQPTGMEEWILK